LVDSTGESLRVGVRNRALGCAGNEGELDALAAVDATLALGRPLGRGSSEYARRRDTTRPEDLAHDVPVHLVARDSDALRSHRASLGHALSDGLEDSEPDRVRVELVDMLLDDAKRGAPVDDLVADDELGIP
jgi:hypothetical protein